METLTHVLRQPPDEVVAWLDSVQHEDTTSLTEFNWLGLAEAASTNALACNDYTQSLSWGEVAIRVYDDLRRQSTSVSDSLSMLLSVMYLRASLIVRFGERSATSILDPDQVLTLFLFNAPFKSAHEAARLLDRTSSTVEDIRRLRILKNLLGPIELLVKQGYADYSLDMDAWLSLKNELP